ncbi:DedA family protein [Pedobacter puniceum]|uniref:DedA family protein n=1 Tax=Pedobacter puniceum TaxID=2666136 RepID=A0A7K0FIC2_9SPHI|nr:DedA family protein [Pedobacter puniceum]MRX45726.1 DedA family protein [Pedobacter puniceum]
MEFILYVFDFIINIDKHLSEIIANYQFWTYLILFIIIFAETGFVVTPFLPGDPLLFAAGALIAGGGTGLNIYLLALLLIIAAIAGNQVNYFLGNYFGPKVFKPENRILKYSYYEKTQVFFLKHGGKSVVFSRFFPVLRTFVPFVAGVIKMPISKFSYYNVTGALIWIIGFLFLGYLFGNLDFVKNNFSWVILIISLFTTLPPIIGAIYAKKSDNKAA